MALNYNARAAEIMLHLVTHSAHGYSQPARAGDGTIETVKLSDGTVTTVHGGDYDCSEAVRMCYVAAGVLPRGCYMWTGNEATLLKSHGFANVGLGDLRVGDVLLRSGHTEMVVSVGGRLMQAGFRISERHTISGVKGDQTGWESSYSAINPGAWSWAYRYVGGQPTGASKATVHNATVSTSVPAGIYQCVVDALNVRSGAGTGFAKAAQYHKGETVVLDGTAVVADGCVWGRYTGRSGKRRFVAVRTTGGMDYLRKIGAAAKQAANPAAGTSVPAGRYVCVVDTLNVRDASTVSAKVVAQYHKGQTVTLDGACAVSDGCVWGRYTGATSGKKRYIAVRTTGGTEYLRKVS
ncbi:SH3 domain-containing protein [Parafannyhessea umbonata]|uniref:SH3b domain-containing protein n=1 Tax=Parafannyhessea umbonata TaxID=604330 RepID=A0A6N7X745_9ACTN|nr:SH3 domain-containing protein [Parafannyhessea umbonata]MST60052.1 hypothetical protein [Parafannyhessea umbonata]